LTDIGNTNRWMSDFKEIGIEIDELTHYKLEKLFRQNPGA